MTKKTHYLFATRLLVALALGAGLVFTATARAATNYWDGGNSDILTDGNGASAGGTGTWSTAVSNWDTGAAPHTVWVNANNDFAIFGGSRGLVTVATPVTVSGMSFNSGGYIISNSTITLTGAGNINVTTGTNTIKSSIAGSVGLLKTGAGTLSLAGSTAYTGATVINAGVLDVSGQGTSPLNSSGVTFTGNSTLIYILGSALPAMTVSSGVTATVNNAPNGGNTPATIVSLSGAGTFSTGNPGGTGQGKGFTFGDLSSFTGVLQHNLSSSFFFSTPNLNDTVASNIRLVGGTPTIPFRFEYTGSAGLTLNNRAFEMAHSGGTFAINNNGAGTFIINTALAVTAAGAKTLQLGGSNTGTNEFAGIIPNGTGAVISLTKADAGTWILSGTNTFTGPTRVTGGMLVIAHTSAKSSSSALTVTVAAASVGLGVGGAGYYNSTDLDNLFANTLTGFALTNASSGVGIYTAAGDFTYGSNITGSRPLTKLGSDTLILTGTNTYSGTTKISGGVLEAQPGSGLSTNSYMQLDGGVLQSSGFFIRTNSATVNKVNFQWVTTGTGGGFAARGGKLTLRIGNNALPTQVWTNTAALDNAIRGTLKFGSTTADSEVEFVNAINLNGGARTIEVTAGVSNDFARISGAITSSTGTGSLRKTGSGTLVLSGANTYNGTTTVDGGALIYNGTLSAGPSAVTVNSGATLGGNGSVNRAININTGGTLAPGNSAGVFTIRDLTLAAGATLAIEIGGDSLGSFDQLFVTGVATNNGSTLDVSVINAFVPGIGDVYTIMDFTTTAIGSFAGLAEGASFIADGQNFQISYLGGDGNDVTLTVIPIPEPGSLVLVGAGLGLLLIFRRRRQ